MNKEIVKKQMCLLLRQGIEVWLEKDRADKLSEHLASIDGRKFIKIKSDNGYRRVNIADIVGIFTPEDMEDRRRRKNGQWKCKYGNWHDKNGDCDQNCIPDSQKKIKEKKKKAIENCEECKNGYTEKDGGLQKCSCIKNINLKK